jgi:hypothetical protein
MSNEEQDPRDPERIIEPDLVDPDALVLDEGSISAEDLEPELSVSADTLELQEPALEPVEISRDIAEAASLEAAAAEARAVAAEAEKAGTLVGGPMPRNTPTVDAAPDGTAPAGGKAGDADGPVTSGPERSGPTLPSGASGTVPEVPADAPTPDEVLADATGGTTGSATPHPTPEEVLADVGSGTTGSATPHPTPDEVIADTRERASASGTGHSSTGSTGTGAHGEDGMMLSTAATEDSPTSGVPNQDIGDRTVDPPTDAPATGSPAAPRPGPERAHGSHPAGATGQRTPADEGRTAVPAEPPVAAGGNTAGDSPWVPAGGDSGEAPGPEGPSRRDRSRGKSSRTPLLLIVGGAVVVLGLIVWLLVSLLGGSEDEDQVNPSSLAAGDCLADFTDITAEARLVDCTEPHNAQLVASESYPDGAEFPGRDQLGLRAESACAAASANVDPGAVSDVEVSLLRATPTQDTWADGDRRVDCFAVVENEGTVSRSMLNS